MDNNELSNLFSNLDPAQVKDFVEKTTQATFETGRKLGGELSDFIDDLFDL